MVNLPIAGTAQPSRVQAPRAARPAGLAQAGLIALLVENDPQMRRAISVLMESWGANVIEAEDAASALSLLEDLQITPDVLLLDYQLGPGLSGTQLYSEIVRRLGALPCAIVSADRSVTLRQDCKALDLVLLNKPLDRHKLAGFLDKAAPGPTER